MWLVNVPTISGYFWMTYSPESWIRPQIIQIDYDVDKGSFFILRIGSATELSIVEFNKKYPCAQFQRVIEP